MGIAGLTRSFHHIHHGLMSAGGIGNDDDGRILAVTGGLAQRQADRFDSLLRHIRTIDDIATAGVDVDRNHHRLILWRIRFGRRQVDLQLADT